MFVLTGPTTAARTVVTDFLGRAPLGALALAPGDYAVTAYFGGTIPTPGGAVTLDDPAYGASSVSSSLILEPNDSTPPVIEPVVAGTLGNNGWYTSNVGRHLDGPGAGQPLVARRRPVATRGRSSPIRRRRPTRAVRRATAAARHGR